MIRYQGIKDSDETVLAELAGLKSELEQIKKNQSSPQIPVNQPSVQAAFDGTIILPGNVVLDMIKVEKGTFTMSARDGENDDDEVEHRKTLTKDFYIGKYPVTQVQWKAIMGSNPSSFKKGDDYPVEEVSWHDAIDFCEKLNEKGLAPDGWRFTLPTETQWEYAAKGGNKSRGYKYAGGNDLDSVGWYDDNSGSSTHAVGGKAPNELGIYDMSGNVWEWCLDDWGDDSSVTRAEFIRGRDSSASSRANRGGSWFYDARLCRSAFRNYYVVPDDRNYSLGFRVALFPVH